MKIVEIDNCTECPFVNVNLQGCDGIAKDKQGYLITKENYQYPGIPVWCPLDTPEDYVEKQKVK